MAARQVSFGLDHVSDVQRFAGFATAASLRDAVLAERAHCTAPAALALRAVDSAFHSDVQGAIALLRRALTCADDEEAPYIADLLAQFLVSTGDFESLEPIVRVLKGAPPSLTPAAGAMFAVVHAVRGDATTSRSLARSAMRSARDADAPYELGRVLNRSAVAAYYRGDYDEARELALDAAHILELQGASWSVAACYSVAAGVAQDWTQNGALAANYFARMVVHAERAGHSAMRRSAVAACFNVAAERFDETTHSAMRNLLLARPEAQQHQEAGVIVIADALGFGWKGEFAAAEATLAAFAATPRASAQQRGLVMAFLALIAASNGDDDLARARSRIALERTAGVTREPLHERRFRGLARLLSAATCFIIGDIVRGQRALAERYDAGHRYRDLLMAETIDLSSCPELFRGYAQFINVAAARARALRPGYGLTRAEADLLAALPQGSTLADLARELNKSKHTVARQVESIYHKLGARNRAQAVQKARDVGLIH